MTDAHPHNGTQVSTSDNDENTPVQLMAFYRWSENEWAQVTAINTRTDTVQLFDVFTHDRWSVSLTEFEHGLEDGTITQVAIDTAPIPTNS
jgi:hypothetical protein